jgi:hypothetical protein
LPTLEGLKDFADRFRQLSEVSAEIDKYDNVVNFLKYAPDTVEAVVKGGLGQISELRNLLGRLSGADLRDTLKIRDITPRILRELLDDEGLTVAEIKAGFATICFVAGTQVVTSRGNTTIEDLQPGDFILAADPQIGLVKECEVVRRFHRQVLSVTDIYIGDEIISCTPEHPFWVPGKGWLTARNLAVGMQLLTKDGETIQIQDIQQREGEFDVYNIEVESLHTYFVSRLNILVHNECGLRVVKRSTMAENIVTDVNGAQVIINGKPVMVYGQAFDGSSTTPGHGQAMVNLVQRLAPTGDYEYFTLQRSWRTATGRVGTSFDIPDVIGVRRDGTVDAWEVWSNSQNTPSGLVELRQKLARGQNSLPTGRRGQIDVIAPEP